MVTKEDIICIKLSKEEILRCIQRTIEIDFIDNLRVRHPNIQFDCKLRGYVGEYAIKKWFVENDINIESSNIIEDGDNIDIDFFIVGKNVELKTSLIPDIDGDIPTVLKNRDIKLIRRGYQTIEELKGDIHMQVYYKQKTKAKDNWLKQQQINLKNKDLDYLYNAFRADAYLNTTFFVAWIDKPSLVKYINSLPVGLRCWTFRGAQRQFWRCPLKDSKKPIDLISYLKK